MDSRKLTIVIVVAVVVISSAAGILHAEKYSPVTSDVHDMNWEDIRDVSNGSTVHVAMGSGAYNSKWVKDVLAPLAKEWYGINVIYDGDATYEDIVEEWKENPNEKGSYDLVWGDSSTLKGLLNVDAQGKNLLYEGDWESKTPKLCLSDEFADDLWKFVYDSTYGEGTYNRKVCSIAPFSGNTSSFVYNEDFNDPWINYDEIKISKTDDGGKTWKDYVVKVALSGADLDRNNIDVSKTYSLSSVKTVCRGGIDDTITCHYGLPHDYTELASWVVLYPYQFYIPSTSGASGTYARLILESMIYELASTDKDGTGWIGCTDENAYVWSHDLKGKYIKEDDEKNKATYREYITSKIFTVSSGDDYGNAVPYLKTYLEQIMPRLNQVYTAYGGDIRDCNINLLGNLVPVTDYDSSPDNDKVMVALSMDDNMGLDSDPYDVDVGMYMMKTACSNRYGLFIPINAPNPAGAIVVCNLLNNPYIQSSFYSVTGNDHNMNMDRLNEEQTLHFRLCVSEWMVLDKPFVPIDNIADSKTSTPISYKDDLLSDYADPLIKKKE